METKFPPFSYKYYCEICKIQTNYKKDYKNHLLTAKHLKLTKVNSLETKTPPFFPNQSQKIINKLFVCELCNKEYKSRTGLWKHKNKCNIQDKTENINNNTISDKNLIIMLIHDNKELRNLLIEQVKEKDNYKNMMMDVLKNGTNNNNNINNKTFNLQFFLNETCKNAMNISDFVESIKIQLSDFEKFGEVGYIEGLSNIITSNLKVMDVTERPVHCTDKKRETIYIKENNTWEKEDDNKTKLRKAIKNIASKNFKLLPQYKEKYPGCQFAESNYSDKYNKLMIEVLGGEGNYDKEKENKIIKNISKNILIEK